MGMTKALLETPSHETAAATMNALVYHGPGKPSWESHPRPALQNPNDAIVRITTSTICGSDPTSLKETCPPSPKAGFSVTKASG